MLGVRQRAGRLPQSLPHLLLLSTLIPLLLLEAINGQPNYYFKASAPAVKSLPRIGRRSDAGPSPSGGFMVGGGGGEQEGAPPPSSPFSRSLMDRPRALGMVAAERFDEGEQLPRMSSSSSSGRLSSQNAPYSTTSSNQVLDKSELWRRLFGDLGTYEDSLIENMYRSKT